MNVWVSRRLGMFSPDVRFATRQSGIPYRVCGALETFEGMV